MFKKITALMLVLSLGLFSTGCLDEDYDEDYEEDYEDEDYDYEEEDEDEDYEKDDAEASIGSRGDPDQTWAIYWYLCGSDLETDVGAASSDLEEMMEVDLPENVQVIIQTGGASMWWNDEVDAELTERYVYDSDGFYLVDQQPMANMGDPETLAQFLSFCDENYPADHTAVLFWNHGGGSVSGASFDENYDYDSLTLGEFYQAFSEVYELSAENPPVDMIGFDACLMATVDSAYTFYDVAEYLVASEEMEPGCGWNYSGWLQELADDPGMDGALLGKAICDSYQEACDYYEVGDEITLSVVDLTKAGPLLEAYESMGAEALSYALEDTGFFSSFGRQAVKSENYGGNTRDQGYSNLVDLGHLASNCIDILPYQAENVVNALDECVVYKINGSYRENASGLSCYFSYNGSLNDLIGFETEGCSDSFKYFFDYGLTGEFDESGLEYIDTLGYDEAMVQEVPDLVDYEDYEFPVYLDDDGHVVLELEPEDMDIITGVYFDLAYIDEEEDIMLMLGQDNDFYADWDSGIFTENFRGVWGAIDDNLVYMEVDYEDEDSTGYSVPILLNGEEYNLSVVYDFNDEEFYILGARKSVDDNGMADKNLVQLQPGDEITTLHYASTISGDDELTEIPMDTFTVTEDTYFDEVDLGDGTFLMMFEMTDSKNNSAYTQMIQFDIEGDDFSVEILE